MILVQNPFRLPDMTITTLQPGDEFAWDPNRRMIEISRLGADGSRLYETRLEAGPNEGLLDQLSPEHVRVTIGFILSMLEVPLKLVLMPQRDDRYIFRLE